MLILVGYGAGLGGQVSPAIFRKIENGVWRFLLPPLLGKAYSRQTDTLELHVAELGQ